MNRFIFPPQAAIIIGILLVASFRYSLVPAAHSDSSDTAWHLTVTGLVDHPLNLTLADLSAMPQTTIYARLICVGPPSFLVTEGNWTGVRLWLLLQEAGVLNGTIKIAFYAQDGYTTDLTIYPAQRNDVILAYEKDGVPLSERLRLVVPESWGYKWISQIINIELVDHNFLGTWESQGYPDNGTDMPNIPTISPLPLPSPSPSPTSSNSSDSVPSQPQNPSPTSPPIVPAPSQQPKPPAEIEPGGFLPIEFFYAIVAAIFIVIIVAALLVIKKQQ